MAGAEIDLSQLPQKPEMGIDVELRAAMGGANLAVPSGWTVWWASRGVGGIGPDRRQPPMRSDTPEEADLRVRGGFLFAGAGIRAVTAR